eukprot:Blabericola_migrator_1__5651@NODE_286_length_10380_cov_74_401920_g236_i0_p1_GENE_NODE_286_length_10380_cov_74_401920_g236_i0NODE_286_length_10380_cov_74_401920_g236_i0_p1_ORF_typecomplete_len1437_score291_58RCC1/PF00415_18/1_1e02RCC1/PF00415_18/0_48RCC1/PF00415_18/0_0016RCC1/PF00415_18/2_8e03RCC1/PF00415_18/0_04RCC1/PF00415_18/28RCC1_2/PF13540_6/3_2e02RCC1_2/PF13540_6/2e09RCC1_2/PF13540_6/21RCC1_2/PF13540_6/3_1e02RCC1_2/PF13540_6/1_6e02RCC1_2/PF13540_6/5_3e02IQ/PF00612_27/8e03IQ/PF00612_27/2_9e0
MTFTHKLQRAIHSMILRRRFLRCNQLVTQLQALWRAAVLRKRVQYNAQRYIPLLCAAIMCAKLLTPYKGVSKLVDLIKKEKAQKMHTLFNFRNQAAIRIQAWWRGVRAQRQLRKLKEQKIFVMGAEFLQAAVRMFIARQKILQKAKSTARIHTDTGLDLNNPRVIHATRVIQKHWRARRGKRVMRFKKLRDGLQMMIFGIKLFSRRIRVIEAMSLRNVLQRQAAEADRSDPALASYVRAEKDRREALGHKAATTIQRMWRGYFMRVQYQNLQKATWITQTFMHTQLMRLRYLEIKESAVTIQKWWRALRTLRGKVPGPLMGPAGPVKNFFKAISAKKHKGKWVDPLTMYQDSMNRVNINVFLSILCRPKLRGKLLGRRRILHSKEEHPGAPSSDLTDQLRIAKDNRHRALLSLTHGFAALLDDQPHPSFDPPDRQESVLHILQLANQPQGLLPYSEGWTRPLFTFLRRYCISALYRLVRRKRKSSTSNDEQALFRSMESEMSAALNEATEEELSDLAKDLRLQFFTAADFAAMVAPFEILTGRPTLFDTRRVTVERGCFDVRQISVGTAHSIILVTEDLESFLGIKRLRGHRDGKWMRMIYPAELMKLLNGRISCLFGWGQNDQFQLTIEGPRVPFLLHPPTRVSKNSRLRIEKDNVFNRNFGLHLIKFTYVKTPAEAADKTAMLIERQQRREKRQDQLELRRMMPMDQQLQILKEAHIAEEVGDEPEDDDEDKNVKLHPLARHVDYTFRIVSVQCGENFSVALTNDGKLFSWGDNSDGRCGQGFTKVVVPAPAPIVTNLIDCGRVVAGYSVGLRHCMCWTKTGQVFIWGSYPFVHLLTNPPLSNTWVPTELPLHRVFSEGSESRLDLIRHRELYKESLLEPGWQYEFVEIKEGDLSRAKFDQVEVTPAEASDNGSKDGRASTDDSEAELAREPKDWRKKSEAAWKDYVSRPKTDGKGGPDKAETSKEAPDKAAEEVKKASDKEPPPNMEPPSEKVKAPDKASDKAPAEKSQSKGASTKPPDTKKTDGKSDVKKSEPKKADIKGPSPSGRGGASKGTSGKGAAGKSQEPPPPPPSGIKALKLPPEIPLGAPRPVFHYSWKGVSLPERRWLERIHTIRRLHWKVRSAHCGTGFNVIHLTCPDDQYAKDLFIVWGRNEKGQLGLMLDKEAAASSAAPQSKAVSDTKSLLGGLQLKPRQLRPTTPEAKSSTSLPSLFGLKSKTPEPVKKEVRQTVEKPDQKPAINETGLVGWVPHFTVIGDWESFLTSSMRVVKVCVGNAFILALVLDNSTGRTGLVGWGGFKAVGLSAVQEGILNSGVVRISVPTLINHRELLNEHVSDIACAADNVCILCDSGNAYGFDRMELSQISTSWHRLAPPSKRIYGPPVIELTQYILDFFEFRPLLFQYRRAKGQLKIRRVEATGFEAGLRCIYGLSEIER